MSVIIDGTAGISTPPVAVLGSTSGSITLAAPAVAGSNTQTLVAATGTLAPLISGTAVASTSGTSIDFTSIPSWAKRVTVMFSGVSTSGTSIISTQLGDSGGVENTGYISTGQSLATTGITSSAQTTLFAMMANTDAATTYSGSAVISLLDALTNTWTFTSSLTAGGSVVLTGNGLKSLSGTLDRIRITTVNGTDTFDAGSINILYE